VAGPALRARSFGKVRSAASFPPPYQMTEPSLVVWSARLTAYPVTSPGWTVLSRFRTRTPACSRRAKNSRSEPAPAAAAHTSRRRVTRGASSHPRRAACSVSARLARFAAVRSAGAVAVSPSRRSAARHASRTRKKSFQVFTRPPSCRASVATM
jgi:hypothetical protein